MMRFRSGVLSGALAAAVLSTAGTSDAEANPVFAHPAASQVVTPQPAGSAPSSQGSPAPQGASSPAPYAAPVSAPQQLNSDAIAPAPSGPSADPSSHDWPDCGLGCQQSWLVQLDGALDSLWAELTAPGRTLTDGDLRSLRELNRQREETALKIKVLGDLGIGEGSGPLSPPDTPQGEDEEDDAGGYEGDDFWEIGFDGDPAGGHIHDIDDPVYAAE